MKILVGSILAVVVMALLFLIGLFNSSPAPLLAGFCGWSPAMFLLGWSVRGLLVGKRLVLLNTNETGQPGAANSRHQERVKGITKARTM